QAMLKADGARANARKHHARRAVRTSRALNWNERWAGGKISLRHNTSPLALGGSVQPSQSPIKAEGGAVMGESRFPFCSEVDLRNIKSANPCLYRKQIS